MKHHLSTFTLFIVLIISLIFPAPTSADFSFAVGGDHGGKENFLSVMQKLGEISKPNIPNPERVEFSFIVGDLAYGELEEQVWAQSVKDKINQGAGFSVGHSFGENYPFMVVAGNHDTVSNQGLIDIYTTYLPDRMNSVLGPYTGNNGSAYGKEYYFDYPDTNPLARFIMISPGMDYKSGTGGSYDYNVGDIHYNWLLDAISTARQNNIPWVIVGMHKNCISIGPKQCEEFGLHLFNLLLSKDSNGKQLVDVVVQGHDHSYQRTKQLSLGSNCQSFTIGSVNPNCIVKSGNQFAKGEGAVVVVNGSGGKGLYALNSGDPETGYFEAWMGSNTGSDSKPSGNSRTWGWSVFKVTPTSLTSKYIRAAGANYYDEFTITQGNPTPTITPTATPSSTPLPTPTVLPSPTPKPGDANGDGQVNLTDYSILISNFWSTTNLEADFNKDGIVNITDYGILVENFWT